MVLHRDHLQAASALLATQFHHIRNGQRSLVRAAAYTIPPDVSGSVATIFGLHGLPLPHDDRATIERLPRAAVRPTTGSRFSTLISAPRHKITSFNLKFLRSW